jgi:hypothetical protein
MLTGVVDASHWTPHSQHFCCCLVLLQNGQAPKEGGVGVMERFGLQYVRGCEVVEVRDEGECNRHAGGKLQFLAVTAAKKDLPSAKD